MNNRIVLLYKPILTRIFYRNFIKSHVVRNIPQKAISERILVDIQKIENTWRRKKEIHAITSYAYLCCTNNSELIDIIQCASHRDSISPALLFKMIKTFSDYIKENDIQLSSTVDQNLDLLSSILKHKDYQLIQLVCTVFKLHDNPLSYKEFIKKLIGEQNLSDAAFIVSALHLQEEFDEKEILLPLLLEGYVSAPVIYMTNYPDMQIRVAKYLDGYLNIDSSALKSGTGPKKVFRTLSSLVNAFKIDLDNCPNLQFIRSKGAINILVNRRAQQSVSEETFEDMIKNIVKDNKDLKNYLIKKLIKRKDMKTALKMSQELNMNDPELCLSEASHKISENDSHLGDLELSCDAEENFDIYDVSDEYLKFSLAAEDIKVINNKEDFLHCIDEMSVKYNMIGMDSEWKPHFGLSPDRLALIQLAVHDKVYILDILVLYECLEPEHCDKLLSDIFENPNIIKLGCGIISDVDMIKESIKGTEGRSVMFSNMLDMSLFYQKLQEVYPIEMSNRSDRTSAKGLSTLCEVILGKPLNKENRLCDWEKRPLMERQLEYAALDAHCLLQMYDKLKEEAAEKNMNFEHLSNVGVVVTMSQRKSNRKLKGRRNEHSSYVQSSTPVEELKVAIDSSLEAQCKELRKLGADAIIFDGNLNAIKAVKASTNEGRIVICSERLYYQIRGKVKNGCCYYFSPRKEIKIADFLQRFNVHVSAESISSRCITCNSKDGLKLSPEDLTTLQDLKKTNTCLNSALKDNLTSFSFELQKILSEIFKSDTVIEFSSTENSLEINERSFLCKSCGHIS